jgi:hypothetical protein
MARHAGVRAATASALAAMLLTTPPAVAHELANGATVRIQSTQLSPGWHEGAVQITTTGSVLAWTPDARIAGGRVGLGLMFIQKLERRDGMTWTDLPVAARRQH